MRGIAVLSIALAGCLYNPTFEVDKRSLDLPRGTSDELGLSLDGLPVDDPYAVAWEVEDPEVVTVTAAGGGNRLRIGAAREGQTIVRVSSHGQTFDIPTRVGPPAVVSMWIEPSIVATSIGEQVRVRATGLDTMYRLRDVTHESRWTVRDENVARLDMAGMMLQAMALGRTTLHATYGELTTFSDVSIDN